MAAHLSTSLRLVLIGKTGSGKSAIANTILGKEQFESKIAPYSVTKTCQEASVKRSGRDLFLVDTPGLFDTEDKLDKTCMEISKCVYLSRPGPHAILMVMPLGRHTEEEQKTVSLLKTLFGESVMKHMIILFTRKEDLQGTKLSEFIAASKGNLESLVKECDNRCCAFNNRAEEPEKEAQVQELVQLIEKMVQKNEGAYFSDRIYEGVEKRIKQIVEKLEKKYTAQSRKEVELLEKKYAGKLQEEKEEKIKALKEHYEYRIKNLLEEEAEESVLEDTFSMIKAILLKIWHTFW